MRGLRFGASIALMAIVAVAPACARAQAAHDPDRADIVAAIDALRRDDCAAALRLVQPKLAADHVSQMVETTAVDAYQVAALCLSRTGDMAGARRVATTGTALAAASEPLWGVRLALDLTAKDYVAAATTISAIPARRIGALNNTPIRWLYDLNRQLKSAGQDAARLAFLRVMTSDAYVPVEPWVSLDGFRLDLATMLLARGEQDAARALAGKIGEPYTLVQLMLDLRFRAIVPADIDLRAAAERELARANAAMARHPNALAPIIGAAQDLRMLGRPREATTMLQSATANGKLADYIDAADRANWWWNAIAGAHEMLGDVDTTLEALRLGAAKREGGMANVSQVINLAAAENRFGRWAEALAALDALKDARISPYGVMEANVARACAHAGLGDANALATERAFAVAHEKDNPETVVEVQLCARDMDAAAAALIRMLDDPENRVRALMLLSDYDAPLPQQQPKPLNDGYDALKQRPDVKKAIERAGGIRRIPLQRGQL